MAEKHRVAVIYAHDPAGVSTMGEVPSDDAVRRVVEDGPWSVTKFWLENVPGLELETTWFLPVVEISPDRTPLEDGRIPRSRLIEAALSAAFVGRGFRRENFDHVFVVVHGGDGIEWGGWGTDAVVLTTNDHSTVCHEFGHVLGFDHSRGFFGEGGIFDDDYGSRYDVMAVPNDFTLSDPLDAFPYGGANAGPMVARSNIYFKKPHLLREAGKVLEVDVTGEPATHEVWAAGRSGPPGQPELLACHLGGNRNDPHHLLMVEYRQPDPDPSFNNPSRWDRGLDNTMGSDTPGVVVYRVKRARHLDGRDAGFDAPYYAGTISLSRSDYDVAVAYPFGEYVVSLRAQPDVTDLPPTPDHVTVTVALAPTEPTPRLALDADVTERREQTGTVSKVPPDLPPFWGPQEYQVMSTYTTWRLAARTYGVGGLSNLQQAEDSTLAWTVSGQEVPRDGSSHPVAGNLLQARVDPATQQLHLTNPGPLPDTLVTPVLVQGWDDGAGAHLTAQRDLVFEGQTLQESEALQKLRHWWWLKNHQQEIELEPRIWHLRTAWAELERIAPQLAHRARPLMEAEEAAWRTMLLERVRGREQGRGGWQR